MKYAIFIICIHLSFAQLPGFKTTVTQNGLDYLKGVGVELLEKVIDKISIPNLSGEAETPIGKIDWDLSNLVLDKFAIGSSSVTLLPNQGLTLALTGVSCHVGLDWKYKKKSWPHISDHGSADVDVALSAAVQLQVTESNGRPVLNVLQDAVSIGELKIHLHGGASWLYQIFINIFSHQIKDAISKALTSAITQNIDKGLNKALSTLPISEPISKHAEINFELVSNPVFTNTYMEIPELGEFYSIDNPQECPNNICPRVQIPDIITNEMLQMFITDFVANSAGFTFFELGKLKATIMDKDIPSWSPMRLNTSSFQYLIPTLYQYYPNMLMQINVYSTQPPEATFSAKGVSILAPGDLEVVVVMPNGTLATTFTLTGWVATAGTVMISGLTLSGNLTYLNGNFSLQSSEIGPINVKVFDSLLNLLFSSGVVPAVNAILQKGFVLPTIQGLTFINPVIGFGDRFLYVSTSIQYNPQAESELLPLSNKINIQ